MRLRSGVALVLAIFTACAGTASAQPSSIGSEPSGPPPKDWTFDIGPGVVVAPWFEGSANYRVLPIPNLDLRYQRDKVFISARDGGATLKFLTITGPGLARSHFTHCWMMRLDWRISSTRTR